jgi:hypothetical protein
MGKIVVGSLISLLLCSCSQIRGKFDPQKIAKYSSEISLATKYATKLVLKNENLSKNSLSEIRDYLNSAKQLVNLNKTVIFEDLKTLIETKITNPNTRSVAEFILNNIQRYTSSFNINLTTNQEAVKTIVIAALDGAVDGVNELMNQGRKI